MATSLPGGAGIEEGVNITVDVETDIDISTFVTTGRGKKI